MRVLRSTFAKASHAMLLSHQYQFIFIKTRKTAGTSVEVELSKLMGPDDIVTPITPPEDGHVPRNFQVRNPLHLLRRERYYNHVPARTVRKLAGRRTFDRYFKFCVDREPVSKCLSMYKMLSSDTSFEKYDAALTWDEYVDRGRFPVDDQIYLDSDGSLLVDRVLRYEQLGEELAAVTGQLGLGFERLSAQAKGGLRQATPVTVTEAQRRRIYDIFAPTLRYTGYTI